MPIFKRVTTMQLSLVPQDAGRAAGTRPLRGWLAVAALLSLSTFLRGAEPPAMLQFRQEVQPILKQRCYDCHGGGEKEGNVAFDKLTSDEALLNHDLWFKVLKNTRAGIMPKDEKRLPPREQQTLDRWIVFGAFAADPQNLDPGRVTVRRLNRTEYRNTVRDLMGVDFDTSAAFPADDVGYGFDTIGDVQSLSPMRMEKFIEAAQEIVAKALPAKTRPPDPQAAGGKNGGPARRAHSPSYGRFFTRDVPPQDPAEAPRLRPRSPRPLRREGLSPSGRQGGRRAIDGPCREDLQRRRQHV